jgi:hypothetical protein
MVTASNIQPSGIFNHPVWWNALFVALMKTRGVGSCCRCFVVVYPLVPTKKPFGFSTKQTKG